MSAPLRSTVNKFEWKQQQNFTIMFSVHKPPRSSIYIKGKKLITKSLIKQVGFAQLFTPRSYMVVKRIQRLASSGHPIKAEEATASDCTGWAAVQLGKEKENTQRVSSVKSD